MTEILVADVGGTGSRLACMVDGRQIGAPINYINQDFASFDDILADYLARDAHNFAQAALAVAGPVRTNHVHMTNLGWSLSGESLARRFGMERVAIINDFAALAWATLRLDEADLYKVGGGEPRPHANRAVLGPGTGLGVSALVYTGNDWVAVAGEGGHVSMAATTAEEAELVAGLTAEFGHCSAERLLSGPGLVRIYVTVGGDRCSPEAITQLAKNGDHTALHAVELFSAMLGTVAANIALTFGALGGIYLAGGILPSIIELFSASGFRERFQAKARFSDYLAEVPTYVIKASNPGFVGLDIYMRQLQ